MKLELSTVVSNIPFKQPILAVVGFVKEVYKYFSDNQGSMMAAAISCYVFMSIVPIVLVAVAAWGYVLGSPDDAQRIVLSNIKAFSPSFAGNKGDSINRAVEQLVNLRGPAGIVGILGLAWAGTGVITIIDRAINNSFNIAYNRGFIKSRLLAIGMLPLLGVLFGLSVAATSVISTIRALDLGLAGSLPQGWNYMWDLAAYLLPPLISTIAFSVLYFVMPMRKIRIRLALLGGVITAIIWESTKQLFSYYVAVFAVRNNVYGSLGGLMLWMLWITLSSQIVIYGAEITAAFGRRFNEKVQAKAV